MTTTGFLLSTGQDISTLYQSGSSSTPSGLIMQSGEDISTVFATGTCNTLAGYQTSTGADISTIFKSKISFNFTVVVDAASIIWGVTTANNGVGYISITGNAYKTTNYGANWAVTSASSGANRGIASNADGSVVIQSNASGAIRYTINGGSSWSTSSSGGSTQACFLPRNNANNTMIYNQNGVASIKMSNYPYTSITTKATSNVVANVASAACISDISNYIYVNFITNGSKVYRNATSGDLFSALVDMTSSVQLGSETNNLFTSCCNADGTVNLIAGRPGTIYRSTTWNGTFTRIANSPSLNFRSISTSASGNIVCAAAETGIYVSTDKGLTFALATFTALLSGEVFYYANVSPDEKFIIVSTYISTSRARLYYCAFP